MAEVATVPENQSPISDALWLARRYAAVLLVELCEAVRAQRDAQDCGDARQAADHAQRAADVADRLTHAERELARVELEAIRAGRVR